MVFLHIATITPQGLVNNMTVAGSKSPAATGTGNGAENRASASWTAAVLCRLTSFVLRWKSGRGLTQSKTSRNFSSAMAKHGHSFIETALKRELFFKT
jgi:hypothetical protein